MIILSPPSLNLKIWIINNNFTFKYQLSVIEINFVLFIYYINIYYINYFITLINYNLKQHF